MSRKRLSQRVRLRWFGLLLCTLLWSGCRGSEGVGPDAGQDAEEFERQEQDRGDSSIDDGDAQDQQAESGENDSSESDLGERPDFDPSQSFLLTVPPGTNLCATFCECRDPLLELQMRGRIELTPGYYVLPRQGGGWEAPGEMVSKAEFGFEKTLLAPDPEQGMFEVFFSPASAPLKGGSWYFGYRKGFEAGEVPYLVGVNLRIDSDLQNGSWPEEVLADQGFMGGYVNGSLRIGPGEDMRTEIQSFSSCLGQQESRETIAASTVDGDEFTLDLRGCNACGCSGMTVCTLLVGARVSLGGGETREVTDLFHLAYSAAHHNFHNQFMIRLDPPIAGATLLQLIAPDRMDPQWWSGLIVLDADFTEIRRTTFSIWEVRP